ncbi:hypothetical protein PS720_00351 [Pseudomonas fluorescens]|nr:hypothetical protein PS720_00351 [Pseudomonas fluorescens]
MQRNTSTYSSKKLPSLLTTLARDNHVSIIYFDRLAFSNKLRAAPDVAGLTDLDTPCQAIYPDVKPVCESPDARCYWDEWHPTRQVHILAAEAMLETLKFSR